MPTYGGPETAQKNPPSAHILVLNGLILNLEAELAALKLKRAAGPAGCNHHFVPEPGTLCELHRALAGRFYAGEMVSGGAGRIRSTVTFTLVCSRCQEQCGASISERCPVCASATTGAAAEGTLSDYVETHGQGWGYYLPWLISCPCCEFRAIGKIYDR